jgi:hypothetical protein
MLERVGLPRAAWRLPLLVAHGAGALLEGLWTGLALAGEPPLTRFVASQLARSHSYSPSAAGAAFGYAPLVNGSEAFERTAVWWRQELRRLEEPETGGRLCP